MEVKKRKALVVGVEKYDPKSGYSILQNSINDAEEMVQALEGLGFEVFPSINPTRT